MIAALTKRIEEISPPDLQELIGWPETENVEYKRDLTEPEPWSARGDLTNPSKKKIFKELVAFANTSGGRLFLGIDETADKPPRAERIYPISRCGDLRDLLEQALASNIDPPLSFFRVWSIKTEGDAGVVVIEVPASHSGPHQSRLDPHCYARKGTTSVQMGMREIQDAVIRLSRRQDGIRNTLIERQNLFRAWSPSGSDSCVALRVTALPVSAPLYVDQVFGNRTVSKNFEELTGKWVAAASESEELFYPPTPPGSLSERRVLGGTEWNGGGGRDQVVKQTILRNGLVEVWFKHGTRRAVAQREDQKCPLIGSWPCRRTRSLRLTLFAIQPRHRLANMRWNLSCALLVAQRIATYN